MRAHRDLGIGYEQYGCRYEWYDHGTAVVFFFNDTATAEIYTLSLHDALPIFVPPFPPKSPGVPTPCPGVPGAGVAPASSPDRKSTRLNSSHANISYAVFCLKKKIAQSKTQI